MIYKLTIEQNMFLKNVAQDFEDSRYYYNMKDKITIEEFNLVEVVLTTMEYPIYDKNVLNKIASKYRSYGKM